MPRHPLIDAYLRDLADRLPADVADELTDGLLETYDHQRSRGLSPDQAARAALTDFGTTEQIVQAFTRLTPGRRTARTLLATGPLIGICWAVALVTGHAWRWPIPTAARLAFGALLVTAVGTLAFAARGSYPRPRRTAALTGTCGLLLLDGTAITTALTAAIAAAMTAAPPPAPAWPLLLAIFASLTRVGLTVPALRSLVAGH